MDNINTSSAVHYNLGLCTATGKAQAKDKENQPLASDLFVLASSSEAEESR